MSKPLSEQPNELYEAVRGLEVARSVLEDLYERLERVRELHKPTTADNGSVCGESGCCGEYEEWTICAECDGADYPCPTIKALDGEQG